MRNPTADPSGTFFKRRKPKTGFRLRHPGDDHFGSAPVASGAQARCRVGSGRWRGFSIVELVVLIAILLVAAAIAIPNLLHSNLSENESSAVASLRNLDSACEDYARLYGGYPKRLSDLGPGSPANPTSANWIDAVLASGTKSGYVFTYVPGAPSVSGNRRADRRVREAPCTKGRITPTKDSPQGLNSCANPATAASATAHTPITKRGSRWNRRTDHSSTRCPSSTRHTPR